MNKQLYHFYGDGDTEKILLLTDDQAAVFFWLKDEGWPIELVLINDTVPVEISVDKYFPAE